MRIGFDHIYQTNRDEQTFRALGERGFILDPKCVEHPGSMFCRFIKFNTVKPTTAGMGYQYLEFAEVKDDRQAHTDHPTATEAQLWGPGISLNADANLETAKLEIEAELADLKPKVMHKNYDWKNDNVSRLPGWNFLTFDEWVYPDTMVWCTEYEDSPTRSKEYQRFDHPNTAEAIVGLILNRAIVEAKNLARACRAPIASGGFTLADGTLVYGADHTSLPPELHQLKKGGPIRAVVLTCRDFTEFTKQARPHHLFKWGDIDAGLIQMPDNCWDILVIDREA